MPLPPASNDAKKATFFESLSTGGAVENPLRGPETSAINVTPETFPRQILSLGPVRAWNATSKKLLSDGLLKRLNPPLVLATLANA
jgi:hypothetical protein